MAAPATSRASGEASPEAPISAAMVSVVAAVGATLVMDAIQSPRSPTDLWANPWDEGSVVMTRNLSGALDGQDGRSAGRTGNDRPVGGVGEGDGGAVPADEERVLGLRAADGRVPGEGAPGRDEFGGVGPARHDVELTGQVADRAALDVLAPLAVEPGVAVRGLPHGQGLFPAPAGPGRADQGRLHRAGRQVPGRELGVWVARADAPGARDVQPAAHAGYHGQRVAPGHGGGRYRVPERPPAFGPADQEHRGEDEAFLERAGDPRGQVALPLEGLPAVQGPLQGPGAVRAEGREPVVFRGGQWHPQRGGGLGQLEPAG